ncbi:MAG: XRE family transcriptional regulator [Nevskiaceae bacterium]|nr:MAG: XRE family transcriptional regulator [Nevskiaceae bacterium]
MRRKPRKLTLRQTLAVNVRRERTRHQWSQRQLADFAEISQTYVSQVEAAQRAVSLDVVDKLAAAFEFEDSARLLQR